MEKLKNSPLFLELNKLTLPREDFAIFGSGPLFVHGLRDTISELDIVARGKAWEKAAALSAPEGAEMGGRIINLVGGLISIYDSWEPQPEEKPWNLQELIDTADIFAEMRFVSLQHVLTWKKLMNRPKDQADIRAIEQLIRSLSNPRPTI